MTGTMLGPETSPVPSQAASLAAQGPAIPVFHAPGPRELRSQAIQRLQVGLFGLAAMLLLVGLANIIMDRARMADSAAGVTVAAHAASTGTSGSDPLADLGVIPAPDAGSAPRDRAAPRTPPR